MFFVDQLGSDKLNKMGRDKLKYNGHFLLLKFTIIKWYF
jgi:hypothetical protein